MTIVSHTVTISPENSMKFSGFNTITIKEPFTERLAQHSSIYRFFHNYTPLSPPTHIPFKQFRVAVKHAFAHVVFPQV